MNFVMEESYHASKSEALKSWEGGGWGGCRLRRVCERLSASRVPLPNNAYERVWELSRWYSFVYCIMCI